nr:hypothetical protein [Streptomyces melanosporofaciens]
MRIAAWQLRDGRLARASDGTDLGYARVEFADESVHADKTRLLAELASGRWPPTGDQRSSG